MAKRKKSWLDRYMEYTDNTEPPILYRKWVAIHVMAAALQRKCWFDLGHLTFYPNMYVVLVGPPGKCRKGTAMSTGKKLLRAAGIKTTAEAITREALIQQLEENSTTATFEDKPIIHCSTNVFSPELAVFLGQDNKTLISDLTDWFDCADRWTYRTKNKGTDELIGVWVNLIGATTPQLIQSQLPQDAVGGGLASRIVFVYEDKKNKTVPFPFITEEQQAIGKELVVDLEELFSMSGRFTVDEEWLTMYGEWYAHNDQQPAINDERFAGYNERRAVHLIKLCMIMSASMRDDRIMNAEVFTEALNLLLETEKKMPRTFGGYGSSESADLTYRVMEVIAFQKKVSVKNLLQKFYYDLNDKDHLEKILTVLIGMRFCRQVSNGREHFMEYIDENEMNQQFTEE